MFRCHIYSARYVRAVSINKFKFVSAQSGPLSKTLPRLNERSSIHSFYSSIVKQTGASKNKYFWKTVMYLSEMATHGA